MTVALVVLGSLLLFAGTIRLLREERRKVSRDILLSLISAEGPQQRIPPVSGGPQATLSGESLSPKAPKKTLPTVAAVALGAGVWSLAGGMPADLGVGLLVLSAAMYLLHSRRTKRPQHGLHQEILFFLPIFLERLAMALRAGHDLVPALEVVVDLEEEAANRETRAPDPVCIFFRQILSKVHDGIAFTDALDTLRANVPTAPLRHALLYLGIAQRDGGDLIGPIIELADATQLAYEEFVEEEVAKLPAKALLPLLCTFAGLFLCLVTPPIVQVLKVTTTFATSGGQQ